MNGERVALFDIDPLMTAGENDLRTPPIKVKAGPQTISASFVNLADGPIEDPIWRPERSLADDFSGQVEGLTNPPHLRDLTIMGPFNATGVSESPSRRKIFTCLPANASEEGPCATEIITTLARQAFRRPLTAENIEELMSAYQEGAGQGDFDTGIRMALQFIIANPEFVFRVERTPVNAAPGENYRISDPELASRLAFFLWSTLPDDELNSLAGQGQLKDPTVLEQQVRRMLADPRSEALATLGCAPRCRLVWAKTLRGNGSTCAISSDCSQMCTCLRMRTRTCLSRCGERPRCSSTPSSARTEILSIS